MIGDLAGTGRGGLSLTPTEWRMLTELVRNAGQVLTYEILLRRVWGDAYVGASEYIKKKTLIIKCGFFFPDLLDFQCVPVAVKPLSACD